VSGLQGSSASVQRGSRRQDTQTLGERINSEFALRALGQILECDFWLALADHEVDDDEALEDNGPGRVAQAVGEGAEDLSDTGLAGVRSDEYMLDIL
jgi:hypothetical protein